MKQSSSKVFDIWLVIILIISLSVILYTASSLFFFKSYAYYQKDRLEAITQGILAEVEKDVQKAFNLLNIVSEQVEANVITKSQFPITIKENTFKLFHDIRIFFKENYQNKDSIDRTKEIFDVITISKPLANQGTFTIKADYKAVVKEINNYLNDSDVFYAFYNEAGKLILSNNMGEQDNLGPSIYIDKSLAHEIKVRIWFSEKKIYQQKLLLKNIALLGSMTVSALILVSYLLCRWFLRKKMFEEYTKQAIEFKEKSEELQNYKVSAEAKKEMHLIMLQGVRDITYNLKEMMIACRGSLEQSKYNAELIDFLKNVERELSNIQYLKVATQGSNIVNIRTVLEKSISYWFLEIQKKRIEIALNCNVGEVDSLINKAGFAQIICSVLGIIIISMPKRRQINIKAEVITDQICFEITDNGLGITLDSLPLYSNGRKEHIEFTLSWAKLTSLLKELNIKYAITSNAGVGNNVRLFLPIYQEKKTYIKGNATNVVHLSDVKKN